MDLFFPPGCSPVEMGGESPAVISLPLESSTILPTNAANKLKGNAPAKNPAKKEKNTGSRSPAGEAKVAAKKVSAKKKQNASPRLGTKSPKGGGNERTVSFGA